MIDGTGGDVSAGSPLQRPASSRGTACVSGGVGVGAGHRFGLAPAPVHDQDVARQNDLVCVPDPTIQTQPSAAQIGGSALGYRDQCAPLAIRARPSRQVARPHVYASPALGVNVRLCRSAIDSRSGCGLGCCGPWILAVVARSAGGGSDDPVAVPDVYRGTAGRPGPVLFTLEVDGERFAIRQGGYGGTNYDVAADISKLRGSVVPDVSRTGIDHGEEDADVLLMLLHRPIRCPARRESVALVGPAQPVRSCHAAHRYVLLRRVRTSLSLCPGSQSARKPARW